MIEANLSKTRRQLTPKYLCLVLAAAGVVPLALPQSTQTLELKPYGVSVRYPPSWSAVPSRYGNAYELTRVAPGQAGLPGSTSALQILITVEPRKDHADAIGRLQDIAREQQQSPSIFLSIGGWPALERRHARPLPPRDAGGPANGPVVLRLTTAVAAASMVTRLEAFLPGDAPSDITDEVKGMGRSIEFAQRGDPAEVAAEIRLLRDSIPRTALPPRSRVPRLPPP